MQVSFTEGLRLRLGDTSLFLTIACEPLNIVCGLHWRAFIGGLPLPLVRRAPSHSFSLAGFIHAVSSVIHAVLFMEGSAVSGPLTWQASSLFGLRELGRKPESALLTPSTVHRALCDLCPTHG